MPLLAMVVPVLAYQAAVKLDPKQYREPKPVYTRPLAPPAFLKKQTPLNVSVEITNLFQKYMPHHFSYNFKGGIDKAKDPIRKELVAAGWQETARSGGIIEFSREKISKDVRRQELTISPGKYEPAKPGTWLTIKKDQNWHCVDLREIYRIVTRPVPTAKRG